MIFKGKSKETKIILGVTVLSLIATIATVADVMDKEETTVYAVQDVMQFGDDAGKVDYITFKLKKITVDTPEEELEEVEDDIMKIASTIENSEARNEVYKRIADRKARYKLSKINSIYFDNLDSNELDPDLHIVPIEEVEKLLEDINVEDKEELLDTHKELKEKLELRIEEEKKNKADNLLAKEEKRIEDEENRETKGDYFIILLVLGFTFFFLGIPYIKEISKELEDHEDTEDDDDDLDVWR